MKYTIKDFFESKEKLAIHTPTKEEAIKLCDAFDKAGYKWNNGISYLKTTYWKDEWVETCYTNSSTYGDKQFYKNNNYKIISTNDIDFEETTTVAEYIDRDKDLEQVCWYCHLLKYGKSCEDICEQCYFNVANNLANYQKSTYTPKQEITLTEFEKQFVLNVGDEYKWVGKDRDGCTTLFNIKPKKCFEENQWEGDVYSMIKLDTFKNELFPFIKWEDKEPTSIEMLKEIANNG